MTGVSGHDKAQKQSLLLLQATADSLFHFSFVTYGYTRIVNVFFDIRIPEQSLLSFSLELLQPCHCRA